MEKLSFLLIAILFFGACSSDEEMNKGDGTIYPGIGLTNVSLGETGQAIIDRCGNTHIDSFNLIGPGVTYILNYFDSGLSIRLEPKLQEEDYLSKKVERIQVLGSSNAKTENNIGVGSTLEDVIEAFGDPLSTDFNSYDYDGIEFAISSEDIVQYIIIK